MIDAAAVIVFPPSAGAVQLAAAFNVDEVAQLAQV